MENQGVYVIMTILILLIHLILRLFNACAIREILEDKVLYSERQVLAISQVFAIKHCFAVMKVFVV